MTIFSVSDATVLCGPKLGEGGEGSVYEKADDPGKAIKLYHTPRTGSNAAKLKAIVRFDPGPLEDHAAWPSDLLANRNGDILGLVMPKAPPSFDMHQVYSPRDRLQHLPRADWGYLVNVALNTTVAIAAAHQAGIVIGDVNHGSVRVDERGKVTLIDCDSYQVSDGKTLHRCLVGVDTFTPPELQGVALNSIDRTVNHDVFGLAVMIFQLLMMGRHPFSGVPKSVPSRRT